MGDYLFKDWADRVITECADFPKGAHDDLADAMTQALIHMRLLGLATMPDEAEMETIDADKYRPRFQPLYPAMGPQDHA